ncbi:hypothetical protein RhiTH_008463 [Rhizoctonia solani]
MYASPHGSNKPVGDQERCRFNKALVVAWGVSSGRAEQTLAAARGGEAEAYAISASVQSGRGRECPIEEGLGGVSSGRTEQTLAAARGGEAEAYAIPARVRSGRGRETLAAARGGEAEAYAIPAGVQSGRGQEVRRLVEPNGPLLPLAGARQRRTPFQQESDRGEAGRCVVWSNRADPCCRSRGRGRGVRHSSKCPIEEGLGGVSSGRAEQTLAAARGGEAEAYAIPARVRSGRGRETLAAARGGEAEAYAIPTKVRSAREGRPVGPEGWEFAA